MREDEVTVGFGASEGFPEGGKHRHEFGPIPGSSSYCKGFDGSTEYITIVCGCGETKEIIVINRRETNGN